MLISEKRLIILLVITLTVLITSRLNNNENSVTVFNEMDATYETYIIDFKDEYVTTKDLNEWTDEIIAIYPDISEKYSAVITSNWYNYDKTISLKKNIEILEQRYINQYKSNAYTSEALEIGYNGLKLKKIKLITNDINKYEDYSYEKANFD